MLIIIKLTTTIPVFKQECTSNAQCASRDLGFVPALSRPTVDVVCLADPM